MRRASAACCMNLCSSPAWGARALSTRKVMFSTKDQTRPTAKGSCQLHLTISYCSNFLALNRPYPWVLQISSYERGQTAHASTARSSGVDGQPHFVEHGMHIGHDYAYRRPWHNQGLAAVVAKWTKWRRGLCRAQHINSP